ISSVITSLLMATLDKPRVVISISECSNLAQIYKKGKFPEAFYMIQGAEARRLVGKCLENVSNRLPAHELLLDPFLASDEVSLVPISRVLSRKRTPNGPVTELVPPVEVVSIRSTEMSITITMVQPHKTSCAAHSLLVLI
ncbi:hypothetical protein QUC31_014029, partial [Theobroma cacao]